MGGDDSPEEEDVDPVVVDPRELEELRKLLIEYERKLNEAKLKQSQSIPQSELEEVLNKFESLVSELELAKLESARYKNEADELARQLEIHKRGKSDLLSRSTSSPDEFDSRMELERLRGIEIELQTVKNEYEILKIQNAEKKFQNDELITARLELDKLRHDKEMIGKRLELLSSENDRLKKDLDKRGLELIEARKAVTIEQDKYSERVGELTVVQGTLQSALTDMQLTESRWKNKISELEQLLDESKKREEKSSSEVHALRETISSLDMEIRNLASSLAAESEANETLQIRLERVENEWNKNQLELSSLQRRDRDMSVELGNLNSTIIDNSQMKNELNRLTLLVAEKDRKISELANSKDLLKRSLGGEIQRLHAQLDYTNSRSTALVEKYERIVREKDKMKSLLANDTINRLNRSLLHN
jgi:chromosome segregation ATPase